MAGNPFRRIPDEKSRGGSTPPPSKSQTGKKKVKIQTPPHSPEETPRRLSTGHVSPPPPPIDDDEDDSDTTATADSDLEQALVNTRRNSGSLAPPRGSSSGSSYNPFARPLATNETPFGLQQANKRQYEIARADGGDQARRENGRPALGVDEFKNVLVTGRATPSPPSSTHLQRFMDSSSNTDTSSVSRQSLFDPTTLEIHPESPRTSFDQIDSEDEDDDDESESSTLMTGTGRLDDLAPPAPPKHTPVKTTRPKGPQTVSFAEFDESIPTEPRRDTPPALNNVRRSKRPQMLPRTQSDLNKPLPNKPLPNKPLPPPPQSPTTLEPTTSNISETQQQSVKSTITTEDFPQEKKAPPPPPASRRHRSGSNQSKSSVQGDQPVPFSTPDISGKSAPLPPPPPPSRKTRPLSQTATPTGETPSNVVPPVPSDTPSQSLQSADAKGMPPPPPRRNPSKAGNAMKRTSSNSSRASASRIEGLASSNPNTPPAPPPRRGGGGSKGRSIDNNLSSTVAALNNRRPSAEDARTSSASSVDAERSTSLPNLQHVAEGNEAQDAMSRQFEPPASGDILADMTAFQAEIDALRAKAEQTG